MTTSPNCSIRRQAACLLARQRRAHEPDGALEKGEVMTEVTPPIHVSGVPLDSRAGRRLKAGEGGWAEQLA